MHIMDGISLKKMELRTKIRAVRKAFANSMQAAAATSALNAHVLELIHAQSSTNVAAYQAVGCEVSLEAAIAALHHTGAIVSLPVVTGPVGTPLSFSPTDRVPDCVLLPLIAFDRKGGRLGQGGGYYDATIEAWRKRGHRPLLVGIGFECQAVATVPRDTHDQLLDWIVTELGAYRVKEHETDRTAP
jgi:5-formyltetrahydrofolate cyclo-ligase